MSNLPSESEFDDMMYRGMKYMCAKGHAQEANLPTENVELYEFNIKIDLTDVDLPKGKTQDDVDAFLKAEIASSLAEAKGIWNWIISGAQVGRSGGWMVVEPQAPGFKEWVPEFQQLSSDPQTNMDQLQLLWMSIQHRVDDLDSIAEFIADQQKTFKAKLPDLLKGA